MTWLATTATDTTISREAVMDSTDKWWPNHDQQHCRCCRGRVRNIPLTYTVKTVSPNPLRSRLYSFSWGKYYLFQMEKPSFPTSSLLIWESLPFLRWRGPLSQLDEYRPFFNGMFDIFSWGNTVRLTIDLNRKEFHY